MSYAFGKEVFGIGKYAWYLTNELRSLGVSVDVFTTNVHSKSLGLPLFWVRNLSLKLKNYSLVHSNEGAGLFLYHPCMIETYHHNYKQTYDINSLLFDKLESLQCRKVQHIIVPSFKTKEDLSRYGFNKNVSVIYHGVDHNVFKKDESSRIFLRRKYGISNLFVVINVGRLIKRKRQIEIIRALSGMPKTAFILVGDGEEEKNIKKMARKSGVRLIHFRYVSERSLVDLYNASDVYVHTSVLEGFGLTVLEAMACGLPITAYDTADFRSIVGDAGYLMDGGDIEGIRSALWLLRENSGIRNKMSQVAASRSKNFSWSQTAQKHAEIYKRILDHV